MRIKLFGLLTLLVLGGLLLFLQKDNLLSIKESTEKVINSYPEGAGGPETDIHPLSIEALRQGEYPGSDIVIEQELAKGSNYNRYIASYRSEGLKIYGLLTVPIGEKPQNGWPVIIFNHGYIPPQEYRTTERYVAYQDAFASRGYITFKSDYRGHGNSEGRAEGGYGSNAYTIDVLNALATLKKYPDADANRIGFWGHSMGGHITLRSMVARNDIKAGVIWAGVVASYPELINNWRRRISPNQPLPSGARRWRDILVEQFGEPNDQDPFWRALSANNYLEDISGPVQIHHGTADTSVPVEFSRNLEKQLQAVGKTVEYYEYNGDDHNLAGNLNNALLKSVQFFDTYVKGQ